MLRDKKVSLRLRRNFPDDPFRLFVGEVKEFTESWILVRGKEITYYPETEDFKVAKEIRIVCFPREVVLAIRVLPDHFDFQKMEFGIDPADGRIALKIPGAPLHRLEE